MISEDKVDRWPCPCGCAKEFPRHTGILHYAEGAHAVYRASLMLEIEADPHLWVLFGTGPWFANDLRGCWLALHSWQSSDGTLSTRIENPENSPFRKDDAFGERLLTKDEVIAQQGAADWAFACNDLLVSTHPAVSAFVSIGT